MKRCLTLILATLMICACAGCGGGNTADLVMGEWDGDTFKESCVGFTFTLPEGWIAGTDDEIASMMELGEDAMGEDNAWKVKAAQKKTIYEMLAAQDGGVASVLVSLENLSMSVGGSKYDEQKYAEAVATQLAAVQDIEYTAGEMGAVSIGGKDFHTQQFTAYDGQLEQLYCYYKQDKFMCTVVITTMADAEPFAEDILSSFGAL